MKSNASKLLAAGVLGAAAALFPLEAGAAEPKPAAAAQGQAPSPETPAPPGEPGAAQPITGASGVPAGALDAPEPAGEGGPTGEPAWLHALDISAHIGVGVRLDEPPLLEPTARAGLLYGLGFDLFVSETVSLGLHVEHLDLGEERGELWRTGTIALSRDLNGLWLRVRAYPVRTESVGLYLALAGGPVWQSVDARGIAWSQEQPGIGEPFACEGSDSVDVGLRGALGVDGAPAPPVRLWSSLGIDMVRLSDAVLDGCAPGAGTAAVFGLRVGVIYGIELGD